MSHTPPEFHRSLVLNDLAATGALGAQIAAGLRRGTAVALDGELGAGKTALARAVLRARGLKAEAPSPSFSLVQSYDLPGLTISHFDLYRIEHDAELLELGIEDALDQGAILMEWPQRASDLLPDDTLFVHIVNGTQGKRHVELCGPQRWANYF
ncbi:MAG: tRNA (adenosine(37)-N6)-threonylcarbamoyltransferase complex ATPase subunit type 1 TsaE [Rhizomicrobium sp.]